jgi:hypothetical protein
VPVNMTIIPSGQKWVFDTIYKFAFPYLYSANICRMNRLVLTDEDESEYRPFQSAIATMDEFKQSKVMLCTFHGIWQSFKKDIYPLLAKCEHGEELGKMCNWSTLQLYINIHSHIIPSLQVNGFTNYSCIKHVCMKINLSM